VQLPKNIWWRALLELPGQLGELFDIRAPSAPRAGLRVRRCRGGHAVNQAENLLRSLRRGLVVTVVDRVPKSVVDGAVRVTLAFRKLPQRSQGKRAIYLGIA
jgi:hypothetical protein